MLALLLFSAFFVTNGSAEKLTPELRKSCIYADILTESSDFVWEFTRIEFHDREKFPGWDDAIQTYCSQYNIPRKPSSIETDSKFFKKQNEQYGLWKVNDRNWNQKERLEVIELLFESHIALPILWEERNKLPEKDQRPVNATNVLGNLVKNPECFNQNGRDSIKLDVQVKHWVRKRVWKCEDIGRKVNDTYEFCTIPKEWMFEDESGVTKMLNWKKCVTKNGEYRCLHMKAIHEAVCSVNSVEKCHKNVVTPEKNVHSYQRTLVGGVAIFGSFKEMISHEKPSPKSRRIHPNLFYLGFGNSTLTTNLNPEVQVS